MDPVRYRILGTTQAFHADGTAIAVGGSRLRALLTVLALRAPRPVPAPVLVDEAAAVESARGALGDAAYEAAYAEGGNLSVGEAAALCDTYIG